MDDLSVMLFGIFSILIGTSLAVIVNFLITKKEKKEGPSLEQRIDKLTTSLKESVKLIDTIQSEIESRQHLAKKLQDDITTFDNLAKLKKSEIEAVAQALRTELIVQEKKSFVRDVSINTGFFIAGAIVSVIITVLLK